MASIAHFVDRYEIASELGGAGMSRVFLARDCTTGERVVVKRVETLRAEGRARFDREVALLQRLACVSSVVSYRAHGVWSATEHALITAWIDGEDLAARLARSSLSIHQCIRFGQCASSALARVHALGVVHGDIKPANLLLAMASLSDVRLLDFGLARPVTSVSGELRAVHPVGTPAYMAPEQVRGASVIDPRADVFSLGVVLFECLTGRGPVVARDPLAAMTGALLDQAPRVRSLRPSVPEALDELVAAMLSRDPQHRPRDAAAVRDALCAMSAAPSQRPATPSEDEAEECRTVALEALREADLSKVLEHAGCGLEMSPSNRLRGELLTLKSEARLWRGELSLAAERAERAMGLLRPGEASWFRAAGLAITARGHMGEEVRVLELAEAARREQPADGALAAQLQCVCAAGIELIREDRLAVVDVLMTDLDARARHFNQEAPRLNASLHMLHAARAERVGDLASAVLGAKSALAVATQAGALMEATAMRAELGRMLLAAGHTERARWHLESAGQSARSMGLPLWEAVCEALLATQAGEGVDSATALARAERAIGQCEARGAVVMAMTARAAAQEIEGRHRRSAETVRSDGPLPVARRFNV